VTVSQLITSEQISLNQNPIYLTFQGIRLHGKCSPCCSVSRPPTLLLTRTSQ